MNLKPLDPTTWLIHRLPTGTWSLYLKSGRVYAKEELTGTWVELPIIVQMAAREEVK